MYRRRGGGRESFLTVVVVFVSFVVMIVVGQMAVVSATNVTLNLVNSSFAVINITNATNLYGYEVNLQYTSSVSDPASGNFLGDSSVTYGNKTNSTVISVYGSKLDNTKAGVSGEGGLFNLTYGGSLSLIDALFVYNDSSEENVIFYALVVCGASGQACCPSNICNSGLTCTGGTCSTGTGGGSSNGGGGGGSGGGGGGVNTTAGNGSQQIVINFNRSPNILLMLGKNESWIIKLKNGKESTVNLILTPKGDLAKVLSIPSSFINLLPGEERKVTLNFNGVKTGLFFGDFIVSDGSKEIGKIPLNVTVYDNNFPFNVSIYLTPKYRNIAPGEKIVAELVFDHLPYYVKEGVDEVSINYIIKDSNGEVHFEDNETLYLSKSTTLSKGFDTTKLAVGNYLVIAYVRYGGELIILEAPFVVAEKGFSYNWALGIAIVAVIGVFAIVYYIKRLNKLRKVEAVSKIRLNRNF
ncbi:MAG: hypothetical protein Q7S74_05640 [Nanoarchaeota archaeon]|nr:hypothetical protein [Nanoarchaeota archaeon]